MISLVLTNWRVLHFYEVIDGKVLKTKEGEIYLQGAF